MKLKVLRHFTYKYIKYDLTLTDNITMVTELLKFLKSMSINIALILLLISCGRSRDFIIDEDTLLRSYISHTDFIKNIELEPSTTLNQTFSLSYTGSDQFNVDSIVLKNSDASFALDSSACSSFNLDSTNSCELSFDTSAGASINEIKENKIIINGTNTVGKKIQVEISVNLKTTTSPEIIEWVYSIGNLHEYENVTIQDITSSIATQANSSIRYILKNSKLPTGLTLNQQTGNISGAATVAGSSSAEVCIVLNNVITSQCNSINFIILPEKTFSDSALDPLLCSASNGVGSKEDPIQINSVEDFKTCVENYSDRYFLLMQDLTISNVPASADYMNQGISSFTGIFDGQNFKISNLEISAAGSDYQGLFNQLSDGAEIKNLIIENFNVAGRYYVGLLVGSMNSSKLTNIQIQGGSINSNSIAGGLVGYVFYTDNHLRSKIHNIKIQNLVMNQADGWGRSGGLIGTTTNGMLSISNIAMDNINIASGSIVGGLIGSDEGRSWGGQGADIIAEEFDITNIRITNMDISRGAFVAGLIGRALGGIKIKNIFLSGEAYSDDAAYGAAGVIGTIGSVGGSHNIYINNVLSTLTLGKTGYNGSTQRIVGSRSYGNAFTGNLYIKDIAVVEVNPSMNNFRADTQAYTHLFTSDLQVFLDSNAMINHSFFNSWSGWDKTIGQLPTPLI